MRVTLCQLGGNVGGGRQEDPRTDQGRRFPGAAEGEDWDSGDIAWLLDVIAPTKEQATAVVKNFGQVAKDGTLFVHPRISMNTAK